MGRTDESRNPPPGYRCKLCGFDDHFIRNCARAKQPRLARKSEHSGRTVSGEKTAPGCRCDLCSSENHYIRNCVLAKRPTRRVDGETRSSRGGTDEDRRRRSDREDRRCRSDRWQVADPGCSRSDEDTRNSRCEQDVRSSQYEQDLAQMVGRADRDEEKSDERPFQCKLCGSDDHFIWNCALARPPTKLVRKRATERKAVHDTAERKAAHDAIFDDRLAGFECELYALRGELEKVSEALVMERTEAEKKNAELAKKHKAALEKERTESEKKNAELAKKHKVALEKEHADAEKICAELARLHGAALEKEHVDAEKVSAELRRQHKAALEKERSAAEKQNAELVEKHEAALKEERVEAEKKRAELATRYEVTLEKERVTAMQQSAELAKKHEAALKKERVDAEKVSAELRRQHKAALEKERAAAEKQNAELAEKHEAALKEERVEAEKKRAELATRYEVTLEKERVVAMQQSAELAKKHEAALEKERVDAEKVNAELTRQQKAALEKERAAAEKQNAELAEMHEAVLKEERVEAEKKRVELAIRYEATLEKERVEAQKWRTELAIRYEATLENVRIEAEVKSMELAKEHEATLEKERLEAEKNRAKVAKEHETALEKERSEAEEKRAKLAKELEAALEKERLESEKEADIAKQVEAALKKERAEAENASVTHLATVEEQRSRLEAGIASAGEEVDSVQADATLMRQEQAHEMRSIEDKIPAPRLALELAAQADKEQLVANGRAVTSAKKPVDDDIEFLASSLAAKQEEQIRHPGSGEKPLPGYECKLCGDEEHYIRSCALAKSPTQRVNGEIRSSWADAEEDWRCSDNRGQEAILRCSRSKHSVRSPISEQHVRSPRREKVLARKKLADGDEKPPSWYRCKRCGNNDHYTRDCATKRTRRVRKRKSDYGVEREATFDEQRAAFERELAAVRVELEKLSDALQNLEHTEVEKKSAEVEKQQATALENGRVEAEIASVANTAAVDEQRSQVEQDVSSARGEADAARVDVARVQREQADSSRRSDEKIADLQIELEHATPKIEGRLSAKGKQVASLQEPVVNETELEAVPLAERCDEHFLRTERGEKPPIGYRCKVWGNEDHYIRSCVPAKPPTRRADVETFSSRADIDEDRQRISNGGQEDIIGCLRLEQDAQSSLSSEQDVWNSRREQEMAQVKGTDGNEEPTSGYRCTLSGREDHYIRACPLAKPPTQPVWEWAAKHKAACDEQRAAFERELAVVHGEREEAVGALETEHTESEIKCAELAKQQDAVLEENRADAKQASATHTAALEEQRLRMDGEVASAWEEAVSAPADSAQTQTVLADVVRNAEEQIAALRLELELETQTGKARLGAKENEVPSLQNKDKQDLAAEALEEQRLRLEGKVANAFQEAASARAGAVQMRKELVDVVRNVEEQITKLWLELELGTKTGEMRQGAKQDEITSLQSEDERDLAAALEEQRLRLGGEVANAREEAASERAYAAQTRKELADVVGNAKEQIAALRLELELATQTGEAQQGAEENEITSLKSEDARNLAVAALSTREEQTGRSGRGEKPPPGYRCKLCGSEDHYIRSCALAKAPTRRVNGEIRSSRADADDDWRRRGNLRQEASPGYSQTEKDLQSSPCKQHVRDLQSRRDVQAAWRGHDMRGSRCEQDAKSSLLEQDSQSSRCEQDDRSSRDEQGVRSEFPEHDIQCAPDNEELAPMGRNDRSEKPPPGYRCKLRGSEDHNIRSCALAKPPTQALDGETHLSQDDTDESWRRNGNCDAEAIPGFIPGFSHLELQLRSSRCEQEVRRSRCEQESRSSPGPYGKDVRSSQLEQDARSLRHEQDVRNMPCEQDVRNSGSGQNVQRMHYERGGVWNSRSVLEVRGAQHRQDLRSGRPSVRDNIEGWKVSCSSSMLCDEKQCSDIIGADEREAMELALMARSSANLPRKDREAVHASLVQRASPQLSELPLRCVASMVFNMSKGGCRDLTFFESVVREVTRRPQEANPHDLANLTYAISRIYNNRPSAAVRRFLSRACYVAMDRAELQDFKVIDMACTAAAIGRLYASDEDSANLTSGCPPEARRFLSCAAFRASSVMHEGLEPLSVAHLAYVVARVGVSGGRSLAEAIMKTWSDVSLDQLDEGGLCMLLKGFRYCDEDEPVDCKLSLEPSPRTMRFVGALVRRTRTLVPIMNAKGLAFSASLLATMPARALLSFRLGVMTPKLTRAFVNRAADLPSHAWTPADLALFADFVAYVPPSLLPPRDKKSVLASLCAKFALKAGKSPGIGASRDAAQLARAVALAGDDIDFVKTVWKSCLASPRNLSDHDLQMLDQARQTYFDDPDFETSPLAFFSKRMNYVVNVKTHRPSRSQAKLSEILETTGWDHVDEFELPDAHMSLDLAQPDTRTAVEFHGPHHYFCAFDDEYPFPWLEVDKCMNGSSIWKLKVLRRLGWRVFVVPYTTRVLEHAWCDIYLPRFLDDLRGAGARIRCPEG